ncbi:MAG: hypothetical protein ABR992_20475 [Solirubrobacteraceae bacterium]|jgi:hypothetical protein
MREFARAEEHLNELKGMIGPVGNRQPYPVSKALETHNDIRQWVYRLDLGLSADLNENLPIIAGDFLYNVRSGLDHRAASLVPAEKKHEVQFPIFAADPLTMNPSRPEAHLNPKAWKSWKGAMKPFPESVFAALTDLQPFKAAGETGQPATEHTLDILRTLHDADEHKGLFVADRGVADAEISVNGTLASSTPESVVLKDGTVIYTSLTEVEVQLVGTALVALGVSGQGSDESPVPGGKKRWRLPYTFDAILDHIAQTVLPALEGLIVYPDEWA